MSELNNEVPATTPNFTTEAASKLAELFPEVVADGKINLDTLKALLDADVEDARERFGLTWPGKRDATRAAQTPTTATLMPDKENSVDWETTQNVFIEGDNLEVLKVLQKHYYGQIKTIYIDPPYNTGKDFVYKDNYADSIGSYLELTEQALHGGKTTSNPESAGRFHSNWLNMMYPRLKLARNLLTPDGAIFISSDDNEQANLKLVCDEIFGSDNFVATIVINRASEVATGNTIQKHEYITCYSRDSRAFRVNQVSKYSISRGTVGNEGQTQPEIEFPAGLPVYNIADGIYTETRKIADSKENIENKSPIVVENGKLAKPAILKARWRSSQDMRNFFANDCLPTQAKISGTIEEIYFENDKFNPQIRKRTFVKIPDLYLDNTRGSSALSNLGLHGVFDNPKSPQLLSFFFKLFCEKDALILDFFAGSGSAAHAVMNLNAEDDGSRRCISVQLPEPTNEKSVARKSGFETISEIARERIRRAGSKILEEQNNKLAMREEPLDVGFRAYRLVDTNFTKWKADSGLTEEALSDLFTELADSVDDHARPEALLTEVLLKLGLSLTEKIETIEVAGLNVFSVADGLVMAYMDEHTQPTLDQLRALVAQEPERLVVLEDSFQGNDELKTNLVQECRARNVDLWTA